MNKLTSALVLAAVTLTVSPVAAFAQNPQQIATSPGACTSTGKLANVQNLEVVETGLDLGTKGIYLTLSHPAIESLKFLSGFKLVVSGVDTQIGTVQVYGTSLMSPIEIVIAPKVFNLKDTDKITISYAPQATDARVESGVNAGQVLAPFAPMDVINGTVNDRTQPCLMSTLTGIAGNVPSGYFNEHIGSPLSSAAQLKSVTVNGQGKSYFMTNLSSQFVLLMGPVAGVPLDPTIHAIRLVIDGSTTTRDLRGNKALSTQ